MTHEARWFRSPSVAFASAALVVAVVSELVLGRLGSPSDFSFFLGRFHPLVVHLPIGVLVLVALAEVATFLPRYRTRIDPALGLALPVLLAVTVIAFVLGQFLARSGGFAAHALSLHRRLEFFATLATCVSVALFARQTVLDTASARNVYRASLFLTLTLLSVGAHFGGTVTHGDSYLTEYAPAPFKRLLGEKNRGPSPSPSGSSSAPKVKATEPLVFADVVAPILGKYCVGCHGPKKSKGKLRLDSIEAMLKGGEDGPALVPGSSMTSDLVKRIRLPKDDDDRMPPEGKPGPTADELSVIAFFIDRGASPTLRVRDTLAPVGGRKLLEAAVAKAPRVPAAAASSQPAIAEAAEPAASASDPEPASSAPKKKSDGATEAREPPNEAAPTETPPAKAVSPSSGDSVSPSSGASPPAEAPRASASTGGRAVLADKCEKCHGPSKRKGGLRVDSVAALVAGGEDGPALVPGAPEQSELIRRVRLPTSQKEHMPPKKEPQLSAAEVSALVGWVRGLSRASAEAERPKATEDTSKASGRVATATEGSSSESSEDTPSGAPAPSGASAPGDTAASKAGTPPRAASSEPASDGAPDDALLARVPPRIVLYEDAVAPLFSMRCAKCHSGTKPAAKLRIDDYRALVEGGLSGPGIVPGKPDESFVVRRISLPPSDDDHMPPADEPALTRDEIALVRFWVERGASASLALPSKDLPASALRAAAEYTGASGKAAALRADAGCAACNVGERAASHESAFALVGMVFGAFLLRRKARVSPG